MTILQLENMVENEPDFSRLVRFYIEKAAVAVSTEPVDTTNHTARLALADAVLANPSAFVRRFAEAIITNPTIQSRADVDAVISNAGDIEFEVNSLWDSESGAI